MEKEKQVIASSQRKKKRRDDQEVPYDMVEEILLRLPVKSIIRFKSVSKQWRFTIESQHFKERHIRFSSIPQILFACPEHQHFEFRTFCLDSASHRVLSLLYIPGYGLINMSGSCDGLVCIYISREAYIYIVNPAMRWFRQLPPARFQILMQKATYTRELLDIKPIPRLAFAKAASFDYKLVWLYNSDKYISDAASPNEGLTKCEVFDFRANAWRYLTSTPSYRIFVDQTPPSGNDGSIYWLTERYNGEFKVIVFDLHTETFRLLPKNPLSRSHPDQISMCIFENRFCMSERKRGTMIQEIWSFESSSEDTWMKIHTIDLSSSQWFSDLTRVFGPYTPMAICKNKEILLSHRYIDGVVKYDPQTKSYSSFDDPDSKERVGPYYQSLISHI